MPDTWGLRELLRDGTILGAVGAILSKIFNFRGFVQAATHVFAGALLAGCVAYILKDLEMFRVAPEGDEGNLMKGWTWYAGVIFMACGLATERVMKKLADAGISQLPGKTEKDDTSSDSEAA